MLPQLRNLMLELCHLCCAVILTASSAVLHHRQQRWR